MLKCCGCGSVRMRVDTMSTQDEINHEIYYPPTIARHLPSWIARSPGSPEIPLPIRLLIEEVYRAAQNDLRRLAAMGIRAVLENVMKEKVGDRTFKELIDEFQKAGYVSTRQAGTLDSILEAGHAAIHRDWEPTEEDINALLDITESIVETAYIHESHAQNLDKKVPKRPKRT